MTVSATGPGLWGRLMNDKVKSGLFLTTVFLVMMGGMVAKTMFDHLTLTTPFRWEAFVIPLLVSPIIYGAIFQIVRSAHEPLLMLVFGFQNGFFWQDIFSRLGAN